MKNELSVVSNPTIEELSFCENSFAMYRAEIGSIDLLSAEDERKLGERVAAGGPDALTARNKLVEGNLRLVMHCAKKYAGRGVDMEDLNSMGAEGLIKAAEKYDSTLGFRFSTYAYWWINQAILRGIADEAETVRVPVHMGETIIKIRRFQKKLKQEYGYDPTKEEISQASGIPLARVEAAFEAMYKMVSTDTKIGEKGNLTIEDTIRDENAEDPCECAVEGSLKDLMKHVLDMLDPREAKVLRLRYGIDSEVPMTLDQIAGLPEFNVTRERIRQIENKAIRHILRNGHLRGQLEEYAS